MKVIDTAIAEVKLLEPKVFGDDRGFFLESYNKQVLEDLLGISFDFVQDNHSFSSQGVLRGLHYQIENPQGKLIRILSGEVFDVAVDMRKSSTTFGKWVAFHLSADNKRIAWIPPGFAHGFLVLSSTCDFLYKCTDYYNPKSERCLLWSDPFLNIEWPLSLPPQVSPKDAQGKLFKAAESFSMV